MYAIVSNPLTEIVMMYVTFAGAAIITYPLLRLITAAVAKGVNRWR